MKTCSSCGETKPYSEFHTYDSPKARSPDGYRAQCKCCRNLAQILYSAKRKAARAKLKARPKKKAAK